MFTAFPTILVMLGALAAAIIVAVAFRFWPKAGFAVWVLVLFFVPVWVGATAGIFWAAITALTVLLILINAHVVLLHAADVWMLAFVLVVVGLLGIGAVGLAATLTAVLEWVIPYVWGRVILGRVNTAWVTSTISIVALLAASLAIIEFATSFNPFVLIPGSGVGYETWSPLQERGGVLRAEGAFGHSIALGAALAMSSAFVVATKWRTFVKIGAVALLTAATLLTFSRTGLITLVVTLVIATFLLRGVSMRFRLVMTSLGVIAGLMIGPIMGAVFGAAGEEARESADYRTDLLILISHVEAFGNPGAWETLISGDYYLGHFARSIDNAVVLMLLRFGYVPTILLISVLACAVLLVFRPSQRNPAAIAVAGQLPSLVAVALITQYGMFLWFCVGLAVSWACQMRKGSTAVELDDVRHRSTGRPTGHRSSTVPVSVGLGERPIPAGKLLGTGASGPLRRTFGDLRL